MGIGIRYDISDQAAIRHFRRTFDLWTTLRVRFVITIAVGVTLILAAAVETDIHHRKHARAPQMQILVSSSTSSK